MQERVSPDIGCGYKLVVLQYAEERLFASKSLSDGLNLVNIGTLECVKKRLQPVVYIPTGTRYDARFFRLEDCYVQLTESVQRC